MDVSAPHILPVWPISSNQRPLIASYSLALFMLGWGCMGMKIEGKMLVTFVAL